MIIDDLLRKNWLGVLSRVSEREYLFFILNIIHKYTAIAHIKVNQSIYCSSNNKVIRCNSQNKANSNFTNTYSLNELIIKIVPFQTNKNIGLNQMNWLTKF